MELNAGRSGDRIPGRGKCWLRNTAVDARVKYPLYLYDNNTAISYADNNTAKSLFKKSSQVFIKPFLFNKLSKSLWRHFYQVFTIHSENLSAVFTSMWKHTKISFCKCFFKNGSFILVYYFWWKTRYHVYIEFIDSDDLWFKPSSL